ncbi:pyruvate carboxylase [Gordonia effusa NBRC 100432]|uniref:Pyruvate carboxylase n=1 Tax=Gordonia effusa NBRC 100432 TaxID=1077974 RepID=H0R6R0_9ACTN|nr:pyruvate carboxylase [Gordonia effusa]GAB20761.1 pyruvate carboxylase [Gordonia effusa NBRC 100432]
MRKVLVANRSEIAVRAFRACYELGLSTVAVYPHEDRNALHRNSADEAYQIGEPGHPVRAYLDIPAIIEVAGRADVDAIYPGYGFLSENPDLARACDEAGLTFVGPPASVLELTGNKSRAIAAAAAAGVPVLESCAPATDIDVLVKAGRQMRFPVFVKAVAGGGGRGMRLVDDPQGLRGALEAASREAASAFGDGTVFIEQAVSSPRHIEVQILADHHGDVVHLYERDCSVQRRHQKVVEIAPAPNLDPRLRDSMCVDAVAFARSIGYRGAGTVEFLLGPDGRYVFIEMNPRIQVEHTVTEEVTDVDLVAAQLRIAAGATLAELGISQESISVRGSAVQCRVTTEDPVDDFRPDTGRITAYRAPGGAGVRLDGGTHLGAEVTGFFDSMLVKVTCRGRHHGAAFARARRALAEFRIRGVATNVGFLQALLAHPQFNAGGISTSFIADHPELLDAQLSGDRATRLLTYLADVTVNRPYGMPDRVVRPREKLVGLTLREPAPGSRDELLKLGPERFAAQLRSQTAVAVTDTTFRDAHQSLLATRVRTSGLTAVAPYVASMTPQLWSVECWGGATFDVALRFCREDPWERLEKLRDAMPNLCLQMLLRGKNTVGYTPYPIEVTDAFIAEATRTGVDVFRIFDALNSVDAMRPAIDSVRAQGTAVAEVALSYTGDLSNPDEDLYTLDYYLRLAEQIVDAGAHVLAIKDMAGLLRPAAASKLVGALRSNFDLPVHLHTHDTAGGQVATYLAAIQAGVDAVDGASAPLAGSTSQPALSAIVAALAGGDRATGLDLDAVCALEPYWEALRKVYAPFESGHGSPTGRVYRHEIPGGQLSNLYQQAAALGLADQFERVEEAYAGADRILGRLIKVTPSSKVVGDLALTLVAKGCDADDFAANPSAFDIPDSVVGFFRGELGEPAGGWVEPLRTEVLAGRSVASPTTELTERDRVELSESGTPRREALNRLLFPGPATEFAEHCRLYGDTSALSANLFLYGLRSGCEERVSLEPGVDLLIGLEAISDPDERGMRTVMCTLNGQLRPVAVRDRSFDVTVEKVRRADPNNAAHLGAPFGGVVVLSVEVGEEVEAGDPVGTIEAMKMESTITAPRSGVISALPLGASAQVDGGDLIVEFG